MFRFSILVALICYSGASAPEPSGKIRIGVLAFGTVNWELAAIGQQRLDRKNSIVIIPRTVASAQASKIALQSGAVDLIVSDWIWVSRQRASGFDLSFAPYSTTAGALMVQPDSNIQTLQDLRNKTLGIAGGALDKNWLLLRALAQKDFGMDLDRSLEKVFGAPPLLNQQFASSKFEALINYWHYAARLEAQGYRRMLNGHQVLAGLGIKENLPTLGYVFAQSWARKNQTTLTAYLKATGQAKDLICESETTWKNIAPLTQTEDPATQKLLRQRYCEGRIKRWGEAEINAAKRVFALLRQFGGNALTGPSEELSEGTFWPNALIQ